MFWTDFGEKCIIVQFLGTEKDGKSPKRRDAEKRSGESGEAKNGDTRGKVRLVQTLDRRVLPSRVALHVQKNC